MRISLKHRLRDALAEIEDLKLKLHAAEVERDAALWQLRSTDG